MRGWLGSILVACAAAAGCQPPPALGVDASLFPAPDIDASPTLDATAETLVGPDADAGIDGLPPQGDPFASARAACTFGPGARATDTLPISESARAAIPITHVIVMMKENRAFDHLFGNLHNAGQPDSEAIPDSFFNLDENNPPVATVPLDTTCVDHDPGHQWDEMHLQVDKGAMDGFVVSAANTTATDGHFVMGNYGPKDFPFYYWLGNTFALSDRHFPSVRSGTWPNRAFLLLGTADGVMCTDCGRLPRPTTPSLFDSLDAAHLGWGAYSDSDPFDGALGWDHKHRGVHSFLEFEQALKDGTLPAVAFVDGIGYVEDEHPTADVQVGENWSRLVYEAAIASPLWPNLAIVWTYDEAGGFADHVPPPNTACIARPGNPDDVGFFELGVRVPLTVISPYARPHYLSHVIQDHTSITRLIETIFDLPALTARDANSTALLDMFDFEHPPALLHPPAAPAAGTGGCHGDLVLTSSQPSYVSASPLTITIQWTNVMTPNAHDRVGIYKYPHMPAEVPSEMNPIEPVAWSYVGGQGHTPSGSSAMGQADIDASDVAPGADWPLAPGLWIAFYLPALPSGGDGHTAAASTPLEVTPP
jgi:phospholipase C